MQINNQKSNNKLGFAQINYNALKSGKIKDAEYPFLYPAAMEAHDFFERAAQNKLVSVDETKFPNGKRFLKIVSRNLNKHGEQAEPLGIQFINLEHAKSSDFKERYAKALKRVLSLAGVEINQK